MRAVACEPAEECRAATISRAAERKRVRLRLRRSRQNRLNVGYGAGWAGIADRTDRLVVPNTPKDAMPLSAITLI
jgi:hypothetical protein